MMKIKPFSLFLVLVCMVSINNCGSAPSSQKQPVQPEPSVVVPSPTPLPPDKVAILVLDDFVEDVDFDADISEIQNQLLMVRREFETRGISASDNCVYTITGQAAVVSRGAAAVVSRGAGGEIETLPAPHGNIVFEELRAVLNRATDSNNQRANEFEREENGINELGLDWVQRIVYYRNNNLSIALIALDTSDYNTTAIRDRLDQAISTLSQRGYYRFIVNMSFVIMPCPDFTKDPNTIFDEYLLLINNNQQLQYLKDSLSFLQGLYLNGSISEDVIISILAFEPSFGPLRMLSYYNQADFNNDYFQQVLKDPLRIYLEENLATSYMVIPIAAAGNEGPRPYPFAPAMWNNVLSVSAPDYYIPEIEETLKFNSGEVVEEGCTDYVDENGSHRIPGTSFAAPKVSYLAAIHLLQGGPLNCDGVVPTAPYQPGFYPMTTLGYAQEDGSWSNLLLKDAAYYYCSVFPAPVDLGKSCP